MTRLGLIMTDDVAVAVGRVFSVAAVVLGSAGLAMLAVVGRFDFLIESDALNFGALAVMLGILTWVMIPSQSRNGSVWAIAWAAVFAALYAFGVGVAVVIARSSLPGLTFGEFQQLSPSELPAAASWAVSFRFWPVVPAFWLPLTLGLLLFPNGHPPSPRWRIVGWLSAVAIAMATVATAIVQSPWSTLPIESGEDTVPGVFGQINDAGFGLASILAVLSVVSLGVRYRQTTGVERNQIRWIAFGSAIYITALILGPGTLEYPLVNAVAGLVAQAALVAAYGIAIMRYRLYDIEVVISKTVTYGVLAVFITAVYSLVVVGVGSLLGGDGESNLVLSIVAVAIVAVAFEPLRRRVQHWANVLVYGWRATPYEVLASATARLSESRDPDEALAEVTRLVVGGTGASEVVLWLVVGDQTYPRTSTPPAAVDDLGPVPVSDAMSGGIAGDAVVGVRHRGDVLGVLSVVMGRGEAVSSADGKVLADVAAGAGVLLRNISLNAELAERAEQLQVSRRRLVAAQDAERHRLERDLHDGAQQQVVALKVKLGIARTIAEREGAEPVAGLVASLADTTQEAVEGMRAVAHGIYPPLLESEGLEAALNAAKRTIPVPVEIVSTGIGRYERPVAESAYFAVLGTVTQAVDAGATRAVISLTGTDDNLRFTVDVDVAPGDLVAVEDRIDALDGTLTVTTNRAASVITGLVPARVPTLEPA